MIRPSQLPHVRDRMAALLTDPESPLRTNYSQRSEYGAFFDTAARHLATGSLYWVSSDMAALATAAGRELDTVRWTQADRPSGTGLMVMDGGVGWLGRDHEAVAAGHRGGNLSLGSVFSQDYPVDAISWGPDPEGLLLTFWIERHRLDDALAREGQGGSVDPELVPRLFPVHGETVPVTAEDQAAADIPDEFRGLATTLAAAWHLMYQPSLADAIQAEADRPIRRAYARAGRPRPEVTVIDLRTLYRPTDPEHAPESEPGRYSHRWVVRGHWRNQAHGPGRELRKRIWVPDHMKGPDGAPLLIRDRVNVWRR